MRGKSSIGRTIDQGLAVFLFVVGRKYTSPRELAEEMGLSYDQARTYLKGLAKQQQIPVKTRREVVSYTKRGHGWTTYYEVDVAWRKKHGFLEAE